MRIAPRSERRDAAAQDRQVDAEQAQRERGAEHLQREDLPGHPVAQRRYANGVHVDRLVQALDVEPGRTVDRSGIERLAAERPQFAEEHVALGDDLAGLRAVGHGM